MEDLLEEIVGEIWDEHEDEREAVTPAGENAYSVSGKENIQTVRELFGRGPEEEEFTSLGGFLAARLGHIPRPGETHRESDLLFTVEEADRRRVHRVRIESTPPPARPRPRSSRELVSRARRRGRGRRPPERGEATLVNRLVGEKVAIVSDKPQTTRRRILGVARRPGAEIALVDTPGIHRPEHRMNSAMVRDATDALSTSDVVLLVIDAPKARGKGEEFLIKLLERAGKPTHSRAQQGRSALQARATPAAWRILGRFPFRDVVPISAKTGDGVEASRVRASPRRCRKGNPPTRTIF